MSNKLKEIDVKNCTYNFFDVMINTKNLDPHKITIDEKKNTQEYSYLPHWIRDGQRPYFTHATINSVDPLYLTILLLYTLLSSST